MPARVQLNQMIRGNVPASDNLKTIVGPNPIAVGEVFRLTKFGASEVGDGDGVASEIRLEFGKPGDWEVIRAFGVSSCVAEVVINETRTGTGDKKFQVVRTNNSTSQKKVFAWVNGYKLSS